MKKKAIITLVILVITSSNCRKVIIDILPQLEIEVVDADGIPQAGVSVKLFTTIEDWREVENVFRISVTDNNGIVLFKELEECIYYFLAEKGELNNRLNISVTEKKLSKNIIAVIKTTIE